MCLFCSIIDGKISSKKIKEDSDFLAFEDINAQAPTHLLIVPKEHYENFNDVDPNIMAKLTTFIQSLTKEIGVDKSGYRLITNINDNGGQEVKHLHFHLLAGAKLKWGNFI